MIGRIVWNLVLEDGPVVHAVQVDSGSEQTGVMRQAHGSQIAAVGSTPEADSLRIDIRQRLKIFFCRYDVFVLGATARSAVFGLAKMAAIHNAGAVVDGENYISAAGEVLIHRVGVVVVVHVMEAEHHLAHGAAVDEDERGTLIRAFEFWVGRARRPSLHYWFE